MIRSLRRSALQWLTGLGKSLLNAALLLFTEAIAYTLILTLAWQLFRLGLPQVIALWISVGLILPNVLLGLWIQRWGELQFAAWLGRSLALHPQTWHDYQDWLHDILLDRQQRLARGHAKAWVLLITTWRLKSLCVAIAWTYLRNQCVRFIKR